MKSPVPFWIAHCALCIAAGCASDHRRAATLHSLETFDPRYTGGLVAREVWSDSERGGGIFLLTDPGAVNLIAMHTNQTALGGGSTFSAGSLEVRVDSNAAPIIGAAGTAAGNVIGATAKSLAK
jgi:hypothetical protein